MTEPTQPTAPTPPQPPASDPALAAPLQPKRRKRRWLRVLGVLLILLVLLVALLPTLAGLGPVRSLVLGQVQSFVPHGKIDVDGWSLGWFSPIRAHGVKVYDDHGQVVLQADEVRTDLTLLKAIRQKFDLTGTVIDAAAHVVVYPNGSTNLQHVLGLDEPKPVTKHADPHPEKVPAPATLPNVNGDITLKLKGDIRLVDAADATKATVRLLPGCGGTVRITDINQPIDADLQFLYDTGESTKSGRVGVKASVDAIEHNQIDLSQLAATLDLPVRDIDLAGLSPLLAIGGAKDVQLGGVAAGDLSGELKPGQAGGIKGKFTITGFQTAAPQLKDTYRAATLDVPVSISREIVDGVSRLKLDTGMTLPESAVHLTGDVSEPSLAKLTAKQMPVDAGVLSVTVSSDLKQLTAALPNTAAAYMPGVKLDKSVLSSGVSLTLAPGAIQTHIKTDISAAGTKDAKPISVQPITFTSDATLTRLDEPMQGLHDVLASFSSAFATFNASGKSLATFQGNGQADLAKAQEQIAQLIDLGKLQLAGVAKFNLSTQTSATNANVISADLNADIVGLRVVQDGKELINDTMTVAVAGSGAQQKDVLSVDLSKLSIASALLTVSKADGPLHVDLQGGVPRGTGTVNVGVDAVQANRLARMMAAMTAGMPQVTAGKFDGKLALTSAPGKNATIGFSGTLGGLTLADTPIKNEAYTVDVNAAVTPAFDHADAGLRLKGDYVSVVGKEIAVKMPASGQTLPPQQMLEKATFDVGIKDLAKAQTVLSALVPGLKLPVDAAGALAINATAAGGAVTVDLTGSRLVVKNAAGQAFAFDPKKPITLKLAASLDGKASVDGLHVSSLNGDFDVATVSMAEPIVVSGLATTPTAKGTITLAGDFNRLLPLLAVVQQSPKPMPYTGKFSFTQAIAPTGGAIGLKGDGKITDFAVLDDAGKASFTERQINIANDVAADLKTQTATIKFITLDMASSKAATVAVNGGIEDWGVQRKLKNVVVTVDAVGEKIWPILYAMMAPAQQEQFKDAKLTGPIKIDLTANGSYPSKPTWNESVRTVIAYGGINLTSLDAMGLDVDSFVLPFSLVDNGKLITGDTRKKGAARFAKPFNVNKGFGDFGSIVIDVGNPNLPLSIGRKQKLMQKVQLNTVLAKQLGSLASAIFQDADNATGEIDLTAIECQNVPLMELMNKKGSASFLYNVHKLVLNGPVPNALALVLQWGNSGIAGDINNATLALKNGMAYQDMTLELAHDNVRAKKDDPADAAEPKSLTDTMQFKGGINLSNNTFKDYHLMLSQGLFPSNVRKKFPDGATIELKGKVNDINRVIADAGAQLLIQGFGKDAVDKLFGKDKTDRNGDSKESPVDKLIDRLGKKKKQQQ